MIDNFNVIENNKNDAYCYTEEYKNYILEHKEYLDDALQKYNAYYNNFNMSRVILEN